MVQVALSLLLLVGAGLFIRTLYNLQRVDLGFNQENLLVFTLQPEQSGYKDEQLLQFYQQLFARLDNLPGVRAATFGKLGSSLITIGSKTSCYPARDGQPRNTTRCGRWCARTISHDGNPAPARTRLHCAR